MNIKRYCLLICLAAFKLQANLIVTGSLGGGLGNQMFITATVYAYALDIGAEAIFPQYPIAHVGSSPVFSKLKRFEGETPNLPVLWETGFRWVDFPRDNPQSICLAGFYQSGYYFHHRRKEILELFSPSEEIDTYLKTKYQHILNQNTVSVHIRRGDYLQWRGSNGKTVMYNLSEDADYYQRALQHFDSENDYFIFFSDDTAYVKTMPLLQNLKHYVIMEDQIHWEDLYLMAKCKHHILANSTFSWWGAYLCQNPHQKVIFPWKWFGGGIDDSSNGEPPQYFRAANYTPMDEWVRIE